MHLFSDPRHDLRILHDTHLQLTGRSKYLKRHVIPTVNHAASHLILVRGISWRAGLTFAVSVPICTSVHTQWTVFILFETGSTSGWHRTGYHDGMSTEWKQSWQRNGIFKGSSPRKGQGGLWGTEDFGWVSKRLDVSRDSTRQVWAQRKWSVHSVGRREHAAESRQTLWLQPAGKRKGFPKRLLRGSDRCSRRVSRSSVRERFGVGGSEARRPVGDYWDHGKVIKILA